MRRIFNLVSPLFVAAVIAFAILAVGQDLWGLLVYANLKTSPVIPWAAPVMAGVLALLVLYLSGAGWPATTSAARARLLAWRPIPWPAFWTAVLAGGLAVVAFAALWIVVSDLVHIPAGVQPKLGGGVPIWAGVVFLLTSSAAAPISEEAAFRGYAMGILEKAWKNAPAAIFASSVLFALAHVTQGFSLPKLSLYFLGGVVFALLAWMTRSLYAAMIIHSFADVLGFTILWPHDQRAHGMEFADGAFLPALIVLAIFAPVAAVAFAKLASMTRTPLARSASDRLSPALAR
ncbi:MAG TPA: type II CAAX endopeptidase family protein [Caulobacteraceae bacterium]|nr:type II CAAX endopeptidase family protein [Caulobacteraceae bacterium]